MVLRPLEVSLPCKGGEASPSGTVARGRSYQRKQINMQCVNLLFFFFPLPLSHNEESLNISVTEALDSRSLLHHHNNNKSYL